MSEIPKDILKNIKEQELNHNFSNRLQLLVDMQTVRWYTYLALKIEKEFHSSPSWNVIHGPISKERYQTVHSCTE